MKQRKTPQKPAKEASALGFRVREGLFILLLAVAMFFILALTTYQPDDPGWSQVGSDQTILNAAGPIGAWFSDVLISLFGFLAYGFPAMVVLSAAFLFVHRHKNNDIDYPLVSIRIAGFLLALIAGCTLASIYFSHMVLNYPLGAGGILGLALSDWTLKTLHITGATLLLLASFLIGVTFATGLSWLRLMDTTGRGILKAARGTHQYFLAIKQRIQDWHLKRKQSKASAAVIQKAPTLELPNPTAHTKQASPKPPKDHGFERKVQLIRKKNTLAQQVPLFKQGPDGAMPSLSLLDVPKHKDEAIYSDEALHDMSKLVEVKLNDFNIEAEVVAVHPGPVITRFELQLAPGLKPSKITGIARHLARSP